MKKILVPIDFSENARKAMTTAATLAVKTGATLELLHINVMLAYEASFPEYPTSTEIFAQDYQDEATDQLTAWRDELLADQAFSNLTVLVKVGKGHLHPVIEDMAANDGCGMIVMGTKGTTNALQAMVGSNTEKTIRHAHCPVLAVPATATAASFAHVVFASTLEADQLAAFAALAKLQKHLGFQVTVICMKEGAFNTEASHMNARMLELCQLSGLQHATLQLSSLGLNQEANILGFAHGAGADMIVMATHQRRGLAHLLAGSLTEKTANHSDIPVLCIPIK